MSSQVRGQVRLVEVESCGRKSKHFVEAGSVSLVQVVSGPPVEAASASPAEGLSGSLVEVVVMSLVPAASMHLTEMASINLVLRSLEREVSISAKPRLDSRGLTDVGICSWVALNGPDKHSNPKDHLSKGQPCQHPEESYEEKTECGIPSGIPKVSRSVRKVSEAVVEVYGLVQKLFGSFFENLGTCFETVAE